MGKTKQNKSIKQQTVKVIKREEEKKKWKRKVERRMNGASNQDPRRVQVVLYDLSQGMMRAMSMQFLGQQFDGIWHTGCLVFRKEHYFGGGIQIESHESFVRSHFPPIQYIDMGPTQKTEAEFTTYIESIRNKYTMSTYDLFHNNCNNFTNDVVQFLTGQSIPNYILDLPQQVLSTPLGQM